MAMEGRKSRPGQVARLDAGLAQGARAHALGALAEALAHLGLAPERLHHLDADDGLVRGLGEVGLALLDDARDRRHEPREAPREQRDQRHREAANSASCAFTLSSTIETPTIIIALEHDLDDAPADEVADRVEVVGRAREHLPGRVAVVERARVGEVRVVEPGPQAVLDHDADARRDRPPRRVGGEAQERADDDQPEVERELRVILGDDRVVDHALHEHRDRDRRGRSSRARTARPKATSRRSTPPLLRQMTRRSGRNSGRADRPY